MGLHSDDTVPDETPPDPVSVSLPPSSSSSSSSIPAPSPSPSADAIEIHLDPPTFAAPAEQPSNAASPASSVAPTSSHAPEAWWEGLTHLAEGAEEWVDNFLKDHFTGLEGGKEGKENERPSEHG